MFEKNNILKIKKIKKSFMGASTKILKNLDNQISI